MKKMVLLLVGLQIIQPLYAIIPLAEIVTRIQAQGIQDANTIKDLFEMIEGASEDLPPEQALELMCAITFLRKRLQANQDELHEYIAAACMALLKRIDTCAAPVPSEFRSLLEAMQQQALRGHSASEATIHHLVPMMEELIEQGAYTNNLCQEFTDLTHDLKNTSFGPNPKTGILCVVAGAVLYVGALAAHAYVKNKMSAHPSRFIDPATLMLLGSGALKPVFIAIIGGLAMYWIYKKLSNNSTEELKHRLDKLEEDVNRRQVKTNNDYAWLHKEFSKVQSNVDAITKQLSTFKESMDNLRGDMLQSINEAGAALENVRKNLLEAQESLEGLRKNDTELSKNFSKALTAFSAIQRQLAIIKSQSEDLKKRVTKTQELETLVTELQKNVRTLQTESQKKHRSFMGRSQTPRDATP